MRPYKEIPRIKEIEPQDFLENYVRKSQPVVIEHLCDQWDAMRGWDFNFFYDKLGEKVVRAVPFKEQKLMMDVEQGCKIELIPLKQSIQPILEGKANEGWAVVSTLDDFSEIKKDCLPPLYCSDNRFLRSQLLIGPEGSVTKMHQDLFENLYTVVKGSKRVFLAHPQSGVKRAFFSKLPNFSKFDPESNEQDLSIQLYMVDLKAGETLFIPVFWWHHLRNLKPTIAVSFWWSRGWMQIVALLASIARKILFQRSFRK